ncbi:hypothetical protein K530_46955 [Streptomyces noursei CCRC 11814]|nr:hypothetical protein K530_46955 [Streptomyces noursei CCRC 11814]
MLAACNPRSAAIHHTASTIRRRLSAAPPAPEAVRSASPAGVGTGGCLRRRYARAWQLREQ